MKILCVTDQTLFRDGLALLLRQAFVRSTFVHADDCDSAVAMLPDHPDLSLILIDRSRHRRGSDPVLVLRAAAPRVPIVVLTEDEDDGPGDGPGDGPDGGAPLRFVPKSAPTEFLLSILRHGLDGRVCVPPTTMDNAHGHRGHGAPPLHSRHQPRLTLRETQVLALLMRGMANKRIATHLGIACEGTVKQHVSSVLEKLDARNRTEAVVKAVFWGMAPPLHY